VRALLLDAADLREVFHPRRQRGRQKRWQPAPPPEPGEDRVDFRCATIFDAPPSSRPWWEALEVARRNVTSAARLSARAIALGRTPRNRADLEPHPLITHPAAP
jgi:hypothetical protein